MAVTIPVSTVPTVQSYLLTSIKAQVAGDTKEILVKLGQPTRNLPADVIQIAAVQRNIKWETFVGNGGAMALYEKYTQDIEILTWLAYGDVMDDNAVALQLNARAWQLVAYVETAVRLDPSLGGNVEIAYPQTTTSDSPEWTKSPVGLGVAVTLPIHVESFI